MGPPVMTMSGERLRRTAKLWLDDARIGPMRLRQQGVDQFPNLNDLLMSGFRGVNGDAACLSSLSDTSAKNRLERGARRPGDSVELYRAAEARIAGATFEA